MPTRTARTARTLIAATLVAAAAQAAAAEPELPKRKPGLWETTVSMPDMPGGAMPAMKMCIDAATDDLVGGPNGAGREHCEKVEIRRERARYVIESVCRFGGTKTHTTGWFEGSFDADYHGELNTTYDPPMQGMKDGKVAIAGRWLGACPADMQPGDLLLPNGMKVNAAEMGKAPAPKP